MSTKINKHALIFGFTSIFLIGLGLTIINPVVPFLVAPYIDNPQHQATAITLLMSVYAFSMFLAAPVLGALSDHLGRKVILIGSLFGSAFSYFLFGIGGSLWILFVSRIIEGLTGGEIAAILAYFADLTTKENRTKYFGFMSAAVGIGTASGPLIGGILAHFGAAVPLYAAVLLAFLNGMYGYFFMAESLAKKDRTTHLSFKQINPILQFRSLFSIQSIK